MLQCIVWDLGDTLVNPPEGGQDLRPLDEYDHIHLRANAEQTLVKLSEAGYVQAVLSNTAVSDSEVASRLLKGLGILHYFSYVFATASELDDRKPQKPDKVVFDHVLKELNARAEECIMIGNSWDNDILGANGVGMHAIWLTNPQVASRTNHHSPLHCPPWLVPVHDLQSVPCAVSLIAGVI